MAHAGLTEIDNPVEAPTNGVPNHVDTPTVPDASNIDAGAANAAAGSNWDVKSSGEAGWLEVSQRDPAETDTGNKATPAAMSSTQSWAEDVPSSMPPPAYNQPPTNDGDGFHEVSHHRGGRGRGGAQGEYRGGNRGRGGFRGDRGEGGGRGRGGHRGDRGGDGERRGRGQRGGFRGNRGRGDGAQ